METKKVITISASYKLKVINLFLALIFILGSYQLAFAEKIILIPEEITVNKAEIFLGDVATFSNFSSGELAKIKNLKIANLNLPGKKIFVSANLIKVKLKQIKVHNFTLTAPLRINIIREGYVLNPEEITKKATEQILTYFENNGFKNVLVKPYGKLRKFVLAENNYTLNLLKISGNGINHKAFFELKQNENAFKFIIYFNAYCYKKIPVVKDKILKNTQITKENFTYKKVNIFSLPKNVAKSKKKILGKISKRTLGNGVYFYLHNLSENFLIKKGDKVIAFTQKGGVKIEAVAKSMQNAQKGGFLKILISATKKVVMAKVINNKYVKIVEN